MRFRWLKTARCWFSLGLAAYACFTFAALAQSSIHLPIVQKVATPVPLLTPPTRPANTVPARVTYVADGDTIHVVIDGGWYRVRYIGVDAPETYPTPEPFSFEAKAQNAQLLASGVVQLEKDVSEVDKYGRLLRYVWVGDLMVNAELVRRGYAVVSTFPPDVKYVDWFLKLEREAREAGRGLWGATSLGNGSLADVLDAPSSSAQ